MLEWCIKANLIASRYECPRCKKNMRLQKRKGTVDGYEWRCRNQSKDNRHDVVRSEMRPAWLMRGENKNNYDKFYSDEDIRLSESDCEEFEESTDIIDIISENPDVYIARDGTDWTPHNTSVSGRFETRNVLRQSSGPTSFMKHNVNKSSPGRLQTWKNNWKAGGGRTVTSVAAKFGINKSVVSRALKAFQTTGTGVRKIDGGRSRTTTAGENHCIILQAKRVRQQLASAIAQSLCTATRRQVSRFTVARHLQNGGLFAHRPERCLPLNVAH
ncbi:transposable element Tcb2 transposase [Trichonephila clavipes]|nr:transposable element Tcb2 transposase [Trichonephila clavipes]